MAVSFRRPPSRRITGRCSNCSLRKQDLVRKAKANGADRNILEMIEDMPDMEFEKHGRGDESLR